VIIELDTAQVLLLLGHVQRFHLWCMSPESASKDVGELVRTQTKHRIEREKKAPDGTPWAPWSAAYAQTRGPQHSLLIDTRDMVDGLDMQYSGPDAIVSSDRPYAGKNQATRPFLGISDANAVEIEHTLAASALNAWLGQSGGPSVFGLSEAAE
jgi:hypothetical protein